MFSKLLRKIPEIHPHHAWVTFKWTIDISMGILVSPLVIFFGVLIFFVTLVSGGFVEIKNIPARILFRLGLIQSAPMAAPGICETVLSNGVNLLIKPLREKSLTRKIAFMMGLCLIMAAFEFISAYLLHTPLYGWIFIKAWSIFLTLAVFYSLFEESDGGQLGVIDVDFTDLSQTAESAKESSESKEIKKRLNKIERMKAIISSEHVISAIRGNDVSIHTNETKAGALMLLEGILIRTNVDNIASSLVTENNSPKLLACGIEGITVAGPGIMLVSFIDDHDDLEENYLRLSDGIIRAEEGKLYSKLASSLGWNGEDPTVSGWIITRQKITSKKIKELSLGHQKKRPGFTIHALSLKALLENLNESIKKTIA